MTTNAGAMKLALRAYFEANRRALVEADEFPLTILTTFLGVALWGHDKSKPDDPLTIQGLSEKIGLPYTTVSRHLRYLGDYYKPGIGALGLVQTEVYLLNRRQKVVFLTPRGKALAEQLAYILSARTGTPSEEAQ